jgi:hypothetical protein
MGREREDVRYAERGAIAAEDSALRLQEIPEGTAITGQFERQALNGLELEHRSLEVAEERLTGVAVPMFPR